MVTLLLGFTSAPLSGAVIATFGAVVSGTGVEAGVGGTGVAVGSGVREGVGRGVFVGVGGTGVTVGVGVKTGVKVGVGDNVLVGVGMLVGSGVGVGLTVPVGGIGVVVGFVPPAVINKSDRSGAFAASARKGVKPKMVSMVLTVELWV